MRDDELTCDRLTRDYRVWQRRRGHRFSSDDVVTAWAAMQLRPAPRRALDLGCGLGSVLLHVAWCAPEAELVGVEAQAVSFELLTRNVALNGVGHRVTAHHGDLRDDAVIARLGAGFDLVTGTPPYFPVGTAVDARDPQRARARVEHLGGVEAYVATAARVMRPDGALVLCGDSDAEARVRSAAREAGLRGAGRWVVIPREGERALFTVWALAREAADAPDVTLTLRHRDGSRTDDARRLRAFSGFAEA